MIWSMPPFAMIRIGICVLALSGVLKAAAESAPPDRPPNIVLIIADDQAYTDFGFMGHDQVLTPHLDRLASQSARFFNGYVPTSVCRPSLVTLLTGQYPHQHGIYFNHPPPGFAELTKSPGIDKPRYDELRERAAQQVRKLPTLPRLLSEQGYQTLQTGKYWEGHWRNAGFTNGMTIAQPSGGAYGDKILANGDVVAHGNGDHGLAIGRQTMQPIVDFVATSTSEGAPFFVWYAPFLPHTPHDAPQEYSDRYRDDASIPEHCRPYYAAISQFDDTVGVLVELIEARGLAENTLFVFLTDNGWVPDPNRRLSSPSNRSEWNHTLRSKRAPFDDGLRTPILLRWDGVIAAESHSELVSSIDLVPTMLAAAGIDTAAIGLPGVNLLPAASGATALDATRPVFGEIYPGDASQLGRPEADIAYRWVRQGRFKLIVPHSHHGRRPWNDYLQKPALFDVVADPRETENLIDHPEHVATARQLRRLLDECWLPASP